VARGADRRTHDAGRVRGATRRSPPPTHGGRRALVGTALLGSLAALTPDAAACPYCAVSQGVETLVYVMGFLVIPYLVVSGVVLWMRRVLASEHEAEG